MEAQFVKQCLESAASRGQSFTLLLRGAHTIEASHATVKFVDGKTDEARFEISGQVSTDGRASQRCSVYVSSGDIAALQLRHE